MKVKGPFPGAGLDGAGLSPLGKVYFEVNQLKQLFRQGWLRRGVPPEQCESVAEHVFSMALLAWWAAEQVDPGLDVNRVIRMTLAHELGEIYTGDLTPGDSIPLAEKHRLERAAVERVTGPLPNGAELLALWEEFEAGETPEARFVRQLDRLEMAFQAASYERQGYDWMGEFFKTADAAVSDPALRALLAEALALRRAGE